MNRKSFSVFLLFILGKLVKVAPNQCDISCSNRMHISCISSTEKFSDQCPPSAEAIDITPYIDLILEVHNSERNEVAGGYGSTLPGAARMGAVEWNDELAHLADLYVRLCVLEDAYCRQTKSFINPGRSANFVDYGVDREFSETFMEELTDEWLSQADNMTADIVLSFPSVWPENIGYYARMIIAENNRIGCAATKWETETKEKTLFCVCIYPKSVVIGSRLYEPGLPGIQCLSGKSEDYSNLCSVNETYSQSTVPLLEITN